jgi:hypothetical protein
MGDAPERIWSYCPECGCEEPRYGEGPHKQCARCFQEWFTDIDYSEVVRGNLERLFVRADLSAAREAAARREGWNAAIEAAANDIDCGCKDGVCGYPHACPKSDVAAILAMKEIDQ